MLITTLALAMMVQSPTAKVDTTRVAFTKCLRDNMKKSLEAKMPPAEFDMTIKTICASERDAFRKAVIAFDRSGGDSEASATENADMQVDDYHANFIDKYKDFSETNTLPGD